MKKNKLKAVFAGLLAGSVLIACTPIDVGAGTADKAEMLERYERAASLIKGDLSDFVSMNDNWAPVWIKDSDQFLYIRELGVNKSEFRLVNAREKTNKPAFDHKAVAKILSKKLGKKVKADELPLILTEVDIKPELRTVQFVAGTTYGLLLTELTEGKKWEFNDKTKSLIEIPKEKSSDAIPDVFRPIQNSPNGKQAFFAKDHNLWIKDNVTGKERALTTDGVKDNSYSDLIPARWSPDGKRLFTVQVDSRQVEEVPVAIDYTSAASYKTQIMKMKMPMPGDKHVYSMRLLAIDVATGKVVDAKQPKIPRVSISDYSGGFGDFITAGMAWWDKDSRSVYFIEMDRYHKSAKIKAFDTTTGVTRQLFEETSDGWVVLNAGAEDAALFMPLPETDELLWFSERSGWGHMYLYDMKTGKLKNTITQGDWLVRNTVRYDAKRRELFLQTAGRVKDRDPYYRDLVRVNIDTGKMVTLASSNHHYTAHVMSAYETALNGKMVFQVKTDPNDPESESYTYSHPIDAWSAFKMAPPAGFNFNETNAVSPTGNYAVVTRSRVNTVPETYLIDRDGKKLMDLETATISVPKGWQWPEPVKMLAADGKTDIYGVIYRPSNFSPDKSYPVINHVQNDYYLTQKGSFNQGPQPMSFFDSAALAELGFIVVQIDGRGTEHRGKAFYEHAYRHPNKLDDQDDHVAGIKQLARRYPYMDLDRVGIISTLYGSGGAYGVLAYPDFYKVGVNGGLVMDSRSHFFASKEKFYGPEGPHSSHKQLEDLAGNLKGKLLLIAHPIGFPTHLRLTHALKKANKDYEMIVELRGNAGVLTRYTLRRTWDYLVRNLQGNEPPKGFKLKNAGVIHAGLD
jgi:dipeptidyl-peptidase 4